MSAKPHLGFINQSDNTAMHDPVSLLYITTLIIHSSKAVIGMSWMFLFLLCIGVQNILPFSRKFAKENICSMFYAKSGNISSGQKVQLFLLSAAEQYSILTQRSLRITFPFLVENYLQ